jgi:hypothetical protein
MMDGTDDWFATCMLAHPANKRQVSRRRGRATSAENQIVDGLKAEVPGRNLELPPVFGKVDRARCEEAWHQAAAQLVLGSRPAPAREGMAVGVAQRATASVRANYLAAVRKQAEGTTHNEPRRNQSRSQRIRHRGSVKTWHVTSSSTPAVAGCISAKLRWLRLVTRDSGALMQNANALNAAARCVQYFNR